jgi:hypothetical protein
MHIIPFLRVPVSPHCATVSSYAGWNHWALFCITVHFVAVIEYQILCTSGAPVISLLHPSCSSNCFSAACIFPAPGHCFYSHLPLSSYFSSFLHATYISLHLAIVYLFTSFLLLFLLLYSCSLCACILLIAPCMRVPLSLHCATAPGHAGWDPLGLFPALLCCNGVPLCSILPSSILCYQSSVSSCYPRQCLTSGKPVKVPSGTFVRSVRSFVKSRTRLAKRASQDQGFDKDET